ncbi:MAG: hypothetical protein ACHQ2Z_03155 [Elusimicrobiota bacterium]
MNDLPPSRSPISRLVSAAMAPIFLFGSFFNALPALAQVEIAPRTAVQVGAGMSAVRPIPAALGGVQGASFLAAAAVLAAPDPFSALRAAPPSAPAAAASIPAASVPTGEAEPASEAAAAAPRIVSRNPSSPTETARAFGAFLKGLASVHAPLAAALGSKLFDGTSDRGVLSRSAIGALGFESGRLEVLPRSTGYSLRKARPVVAKAAAEDAAQGIPLDADPRDPASIEKALRALVDSAPAQFRAPSSQLAKVSVNILPSIQAGQGESIIAVFRQAVTGADQDGQPYELSLAGKSLAFHLKVYGGRPVVMSVSGGLATGVTADVMNVAFDDGQLQALAAKRALLPPDRRPGAGASGDQSKSSPKDKFTPWKMKTAKGKSGSKKKTEPQTEAEADPSAGESRPRGGESSADGKSSSDDIAPKFLTRQLTDELDGKWRAINIYQASDPAGEPLIVIVDVKTGEAFAISAKNFHTGDEAKAEADNRMHLISGTVSGRATLPAADGSDHGPIGPIALPLTNVYDQSGKVVAVTDEKGNFSIPDDGSGKPVKLTIRLASPLVPFVKDEDAKKNGPIEVTVTATPGETLNVMLNPASDNPELAANVVAYVGYLNHHTWVKNLPGMDAARMDVPLAGGIIVNGHEEQGNAFYDPSTDSVNLMAAAVITVHDSRGRAVKLQVENTAVWSIEDHEDTHRVVQTYSQIQLTPAQQASPVYRFVKWSMDTIMGADVNESIADVVSYFMRKASTIGDGFYGNPPKGQPDFIRSALEKTEYDPKNPDPHNGVLAQAMWAVRQGFIDKLGQAPGEAYANAMIPLILISQPLNPIDALIHILLWDMREDGSSPFAELIRRIARENHGIDLPALPSAPVPTA